ncbi:CopD family protein [Streptomyces sp. NBC_01716]|uniref:CopD family protein n=1 Tax=Streptomyces sp. NBC_01716 TaxID=2975917 RepID=UPI002E3478EC|nr:CopD family protein [Streptomyces sp. NBC_01716]
MARPEPGGVRSAVRGSAVVGAGVALLVVLYGAGLASRGTGELRIPAAGTTSFLRAAVFVALALHLGELAGAALARSGPLPRTLALPAALAGAAASAGQIVVLAVVSDLDIPATYGTREGGLLLVMANGFLLAAGCVGTGRPRWALVPLTGVILAEALRAHPEPYSPEWGTALTVVHLTVASLWAGGLCHVLRTTWLRRAAPADARAVLARYARGAVWLLVVLAATGTLSTLRRLPADVVVTSAYGRVLIAKLVLVAVASALALAARRRLRRSRDAHVAARVELAVLAAVVLVSAVLTVVPDPHWLSTR